MGDAPFTLQSLEGTRATILCNRCQRHFVHTFRTAPKNITALRARLMFSTENLRCRNPHCPSLVVVPYRLNKSRKPPSDS
jgi:hypothetical protein